MVADSTVFMEHSLFIPDLASGVSGARRDAIIDSLVRDDHEARAAFRAVSIKGTLPTGTGQKDADLGLFFSTPRNNTLMVALLARYAPGKTFQELTRSNSGIVFLFFFDDTGNITKVFRKVMHFEP